MHLELRASTLLLGIWTTVWALPATCTTENSPAQSSQLSVGHWEFLSMYDSHSLILGSQQSNSNMKFYCAFSTCMSYSREMGSTLVYLRTNKLGGNNVTCSIPWNRENRVKLLMFPDTSQLTEVIRILWLKLWKAYGMGWLQNAIPSILHDPLDWVLGLAVYFIWVQSHLKYWYACLAKKKSI